MIELKILIVEDDKILNSFLKDFFQTYSNNIIQAYDGLEALESYKQYNPDLIITDINLPQLDGLSLIQEIRKSDQKTQTIVISAHSDQNKLLKAIELNLITYLVKPIDSSKLQKLVKSIKKTYTNTNVIQLSPSYTFNLLTSQLFNKTEEVKLTINEKKLLLLLIENKNHCVSYANISSSLSDYEEYTLHAITSLIKRLRKKINEDLIHTCFREGYKLQINL